MPYQRNTGGAAARARGWGVGACAVHDALCPHGLATAPKSCAVRRVSDTRRLERVLVRARAPSYSVPPKNRTSVPSFLCLYIETV